MQSSNIPVKWPAIWAHAASPPYITAGGIPAASQQGVKNGAASLTDGFPPNCFIPIATGGAGPFGSDYNAVLQQITAWQQWVQAGGATPYDAAFSTAIGGYSNFAVVPSAVSPDLLWRSLVDNNTSNPDTGGANWVSQHGVAIFGTSQSWTIPASRLYVRGWGGGGGGGGCSGNNFGTGGGGGGYFEGPLYGLAVGASVAITIGAGGAGGASGGGNGGIAGTTSFGSYMSATGGNAGAGNGDLAGNPGTGSGGTLNYSGVPGGFGITAAGGVIFGGFGGSTYCGPMNIPGTNTNAGGGVYPGVGGNGAGSNNNSYAGGPGANGLVIVSW